MSSASRRRNETAPSLFPFMAVLLCLIGALVLILAITVTRSHASARQDSAREMLAVQSDINSAVAYSEDLLERREQVKKSLERRRVELQDIEDHLGRLNDELKSVLEKAVAVRDGQISSGTEEVEEHEKRIAELKAEIEAKKTELEERHLDGDGKKPAFAIIPYVGKNGTSRRPIYIECSAEGVVLQPEGIVIQNSDLIPPGPGNPLASALRLLRGQYESSDRIYGSAPPPYPLLLVRPDGIESYAYARQALSSWDDQFGYELIDQEMELAFPAGVPGTKEQLERVVAESRARQRALLAANPQLARRYEMMGEDWGSDKSEMRRDAFVAGGAGSNAFGAVEGGSEYHGADTPSRGATTGNATELGSDWKMVKAASPYAGANSHSNSKLWGDEDEPTAHYRQSPDGMPNAGAPSGSGLNLGEGMTSQHLDPNLAVMVSDQQRNQFGSSGGGSGGLAQTSQLSTSMSSDDFLSSLNGSGGGGRVPGGSATGASGGSSGSSGSGSVSGGGNGASDSGGGGGGSGGTQSQAFAPTPQNDPTTGADVMAHGTASQPNPDNANTSASISMGTAAPPPNGEKEKASHVKSQGDLRPIAVGAGKNWAQAKAEGKATPVSRTIQIVALNDKWYLREEGTNKKFEKVIELDDGPKKVSEELTQAIRGRVDSWGLSLPGGFWSPTVIIESASDAQRSVARLERLLEGSGVDLKVVPLQLR